MTRKRKLKSGSLEAFAGVERCLEWPEIRTAVLELSSSHSVVVGSVALDVE
jgi:hypothetical protein